MKNLVNCCELRILPRCLRMFEDSQMKRYSFGSKKPIHPSILPGLNFYQGKPRDSMGPQNIHIHNNRCISCWIFFCHPRTFFFWTSARSIVNERRIPKKNLTESLVGSKNGFLPQIQNWSSFAKTNLHHIKTPTCGVWLKGCNWNSMLAVECFFSISGVH